MLFLSAANRWNLAALAPSCCPCCVAEAILISFFSTRAIQADYHFSYLLQRNLSNMLTTCTRTNPWPLRRLGGLNTVQKARRQQQPGCIRCRTREPEAGLDKGPAATNIPLQTQTGPPTIEQKPALANEIPPEPVIDGWFTAATMLQLWAVMLGLGYAGVPLLAQLLAGLLPAADGGVAGESTAGLAQAGALFLTEAAVLLAVWGLLQRRIREADGGQLLPRLEYSWDWRSVLAGLIAGATALALNNTTLSLFGQAARQPEATGRVAEILGQQDALATALLFLGSAVLAPAAEELAYRGFLLPSLQRALPPPAAVTVVAALFAVAHLEPEGLAQLSVVGACLGMAAVARGGNLVAPTVGHVLYNASLFLMLSMGC